MLIHIFNFIMIAVAVLISIGASFAAESSSESEPDILVYVTKQPPPEIIRQRGAFDLRQKVVQYCIERGLTCKPVEVEWQVGYARVQEIPNTMFAALDRTAEREDRFHWLIELGTTEYNLYAARDSGLEALTPEQIVDGDYSAACAKHSSQCNMLKKFGFPDHRIMSHSEYTAEDRYMGLLNERFHFTVLSPLNFNDYELESAALVSVTTLNQTKSYVVAGPHMDQRLLKLLKSNSDR